METWLSFDGIGPDTIQRQIDLVHAAKDGSWLSQVLISHDAGWYRPGEPAGGECRPYDTLFVQLIPALRRSGLNEAEFRQITVINPVNALTVRVRKN